MKLQRYDTADGMLYLRAETHDKIETGFSFTVNVKLPEESIRKIEKLLDKIHDIVGLADKAPQKKAWGALSESDRTERLFYLGRSHRILNEAAP
jgi:hypothetical protein